MRDWYNGCASAFQAEDEGFDSPIPLHFLTGSYSIASLTYGLKRLA